MRRAMAIQLIINREWGLGKNENPNQGSFIIDELTDLVEEAVLKEFEAISERGGVLGAMETGYQRGKIQEESMYYEHRKHDGRYPIVGVNTFRNPHGDAVPQKLELARSTRRREAVAVASASPEFHERHAAAAPAALRTSEAGGDRGRQRVRGADATPCASVRSGRSRTRCSRSAGSTGAACERRPKGASER